MLPLSGGDIEYLLSKSCPIRLFYINIYRVLLINARRPVISGENNKRPAFPHLPIPHRG